MKIDPHSEVEYRTKLAKKYLEEAEAAYTRSDYRATATSSQLCAENAAKAATAHFRIPSRSHNPSHELREVAKTTPNHIKRLAKELASIAQELAPEHGRATYGEPNRGLTP